MKPCWLCDGLGRHSFTDVDDGVPCGLCNGEGEFEPITRPRPSIMVVGGKVMVSGEFELTKADALWALTWAEAMRGERDDTSTN